MGKKRGKPFSSAASVKQGDEGEEERSFPKGEYFPTCGRTYEIK